MNNDEFIQYLVSNYPNLNDLECHNNQLSFNNLSCSLKNINLATFFNYNEPLTKDLAFLTSEEIYKIIYYHNKRPESTHLNVIGNPIIDHLRMVEITGKDGIIKHYAYFSDNTGFTYMANFESSLDLMKHYTNLKNNLANQAYPVAIDAKMLNKSLLPFSKNHEEINLEEYKRILKADDFEAYSKYGKHYEQKMLDLYQIRNYLLPNEKATLEQYLKYMEEISESPTKSSSEEEALLRFQKYQKVVNVVEEGRLNQSNNYQRTITKKNSGFTNGLLLVQIVILLGVILSSFMFIFSR